LSAQPDLTTPLDGDQPSLTCRVLLERDAVRVHPIGSLDIATAPVLAHQLEELCEAGFRRLIVDLGGLSLMDSNGLQLALDWQAPPRQDSPAVRHVIEITCTSGQLPFIRS
jgi:ABC-type transporter Mla MlaB component